jgi:hypothetical protein
MTTRSEQVAYLIELMAFDARRELDRTLDRNGYYNFAFNDEGESGYFKYLAEKLCDCGRNFTRILADKVMEISLNYETGERVAKASQDFLYHLDNIFKEKMGRHASEKADPNVLENWKRLRRLVEAEAALSRTIFRSTGGLARGHANAQMVELAAPAERSAQRSNDMKPLPSVSVDRAETQTVGLAKRRGRTIGTGYQKADLLILDQMKIAIDRKPALNATSAARLFTDQAEGTSVEAKVDRLARQYREREKSGIIEPPV